MSYEFTQHWFQWGEQVWPQLIPYMAGRKGCLEIGSFEGRATVWMAENILEGQSYITCIDTWQGGEEHADLDMGSVEKRFDHNMNVLKAKYPNLYIDKMKFKSTKALAHLLDRRISTYDFIYVDGSHVAQDVLTDACMAWPLLNKGGLMVFDDYLWGNPANPLHNPKMAIDAFVTMFGEQIQVMHVGYQFVVRKTV